MLKILIVIIIAIVVVGLFVLAMSLTLIFKGRNIDSEIGDNANMKNLGIKCAAQQIREEDRALMGDDSCEPLSCKDASCGSCTSASEHNTTPK